MTNLLHANFTKLKSDKFFWLTIIIMLAWGLFAALNAGKWKGFAMDVRCFVGTFISVLKSDGVVEGGTGELHREQEGK